VNCQYYELETGGGDEYPVDAEEDDVINGKVFFHTFSLTAH